MGGGGESFLPSTGNVCFSRGVANQTRYITRTNPGRVTVEFVELDPPPVQVFGYSRLSSGGVQAKSSPLLLVIKSVRQGGSKFLARLTTKGGV